MKGTPEYRKHPTYFLYTRKKETSCTAHVVLRFAVSKDYRNFSFECEASFHDGKNEFFSVFLAVLAIVVRPLSRRVGYRSRWTLHTFDVCPFYLWVRLNILIICSC
jgi:hypothetical protein